MRHTIKRPQTTNPMRYSSFKWTAQRKRGWIFGPFRGRMLTIIWEWDALRSGIKPPHTPTSKPLTDQP